MKAGAASLVAASGLAGYQLGKFVDETFGLSDKISNFAFNLFKRENEEARKARQAKNLEVNATANAKQMAQQLVALSANKVTALGGVDDKGRKTVLNRALAEERLRKFLKTQDKDQAQISAEIAKLAPILDQLKDQSKEVRVIIDGKEIARAVADNKQNQNARGAGKNPPKARQRAKRLGR